MILKNFLDKSVKLVFGIKLGARTADGGNLRPAGLSLLWTRFPACTIHPGRALDKRSEGHADRSRMRAFPSLRPEVQEI